MFSVESLRRQIVKARGEDKQETWNTTRSRQIHGNNFQVIFVTKINEKILYTKGLSLRALLLSSIITQPQHLGTSTI